jgi:hypothetical protein
VADGNSIIGGKKSAIEKIRELHSNMVKVATIHYGLSPISK